MNTTICDICYDRVKSAFTIETATKEVYCLHCAKKAIKTMQVRKDFVQAMKELEEVNKVA